MEHVQTTTRTDDTQTPADQTVQTVKNIRRIWDADIDDLYEAYPDAPPVQVYSYFENLLAIHFESGAVYRKLRSTWYHVKPGTFKKAHTNYSRISINGTNHMLHRVIVGCYIGRPLRDYEIVDHLDHNGSNNAIRNLHLLVNGTNSNNTANNRNRKHKSSSGFYGVTPAKNATNPWRAQVIHEGVKCHIGMYPTPESAAKAADLCTYYLHGSTVPLSFPDAVKDSAKACKKHATLESLVKALRTQPR